MPSIITADSCQRLRQTGMSNHCGPWRSPTLDCRLHKTKASSLPTLCWFSGSFSTTGPSSAAGDCFQSPNYPLDYGDNEACTITVNFDGFLEVQAFGTEAGFDELLVNADYYSGTDGPHGVEVAAASTISWSSDVSDVDTGFQICRTGCFARIPCGPRSQSWSQSRASPTSHHPAKSGPGHGFWAPIGWILWTHLCILVVWYASPRSLPQIAESDYFPLAFAKVLPE